MSTTHAIVAVILVGVAAIVCSALFAAWVRERR
jgi:hypothetical protein